MKSAYESVKRIFIKMQFNKQRKNCFNVSGLPENIIFLTSCYLIFIAS